MYELTGFSQLYKQNKGIMAERTHSRIETLGSFHYNISSTKISTQTFSCTGE